MRLSRLTRMHMATFTRVRHHDSNLWEHELALWEAHMQRAAIAQTDAVWNRGQTGSRATYRP